MPVNISVSGYVRRVAATTAVLTPLLTLWIGWMVAGVQGCSVSQDGFLRPSKVCSPFGSRPLLSAAEFARLSKLPVFPEAQGVKQVSDSGIADTLSFLEMTSGTPVAEVERWYASALASNFRKSEGTCASFDQPGQAWRQRLLEDCIGGGALFLAEDQAQITGVLISSADRESSTTRLFRYEQGTPSRK